MAPRISIQNGRAEMAYSGSTPWHGLGHNVGGLQTAQAMLGEAGMLWTVEARPLLASLADGSTASCSKHRAIVRTDTNRVLGVASDRYAPIQNTQAADVVDALIAEGGAHVEVAGVLDDGERCWMLCHIPADFEVVKGDLVKPYFLLAWGHDGRHGLAGKLTEIRVVCANTLSAAGLGSGAKWSTSADIYVRHSKNATLNLEAAREALGVVKRQAQETAVAFQALASTSVDVPEATEYFGRVFPRPFVEGGLPLADPARAAFDEKLARWNAHQHQLLALFDTGVGTDVPGVRGTAWAAYNAVTEYTDHVYPVLQSGAVSAVRQRSVLFGHYAGVKESALKEALALVG